MDRRTWMLLPLSLLFFLSQFYRASSAVIASDLMVDLSLTAAQLGLLSSIFFYAFASIQIPMGATMDIFGAKRLILVLSFVGIVGAIVFATARTFPAAFIGRMMLGLGMASALMGMYKLIALWYPPTSFATMSSLVFSIGFLGNMGATAPLALAVDWLGWRKALLAVALLQVAITAWAYVVVREGPAVSEPMGATGSRPIPWQKALWEGLIQVIRLPSTWFISLAAFVRYGSYIAIAGLWAGPYMEVVYRLPLVDRGNVLMAFPVGIVVGGPLISYFSDRIVKNRKWVVVTALSFYTFCIFPLTTGTAVLSPHVLAFFFFAIGFFSGAQPVMYAHIKELVPGNLAATAMTVANFFTMAGAAVFQHGMGIVIDTVSPPGTVLTGSAFSVAFWLCLLTAAVGAGGYFFVAERPLAPSNQGANR